MCHDCLRVKSMTVRMLFLLVLAVLASADPASGTDTLNGPSRVTLPNGAVYSVEVPQTKEGRERGLMFRPRLEPKTGMLFVFSTLDRHSIWMKNCLIALDLVWIDDSKRVVAIKEGAPPCAAEPCPIYSSPVPSRYVLEIPAGAARAENLSVGGVLRF
jgi:hypothetical protein